MFTSFFLLLRSISKIASNLPEKIKQWFLFLVLVDLSNKEQGCVQQGDVQKLFHQLNSLSPFWEGLGFKFSSRIFKHWFLALVFVDLSIKE